MNVVVVLLSIWVWFELVVVSIIGVSLQSLIALFVLPFDPQRRFIGRFYRLIAVSIIKLCPMWRFCIWGDYPKHLSGPVVVVSNHCSHMDSFLISHLPWEMKWLGKQSLFGIPFIGWGMALAGDIPVIRGNAASAAKAMQRCAWYLQHHMPICIFPEGTRSTSPEMLPFKDGAFRLAIDNKATILPLAVKGTQTALAKHDWKFHFAKAYVAVGTPIATENLGLSDIAALKEATRQQMIALRKTMPSV